jgi:hypothetical protein
MNWITQLFRRKRLCDDLSEEIREHLEEKVEALVDAGMSREEAWAAARREFGDVTQVEEYSRELWQWPGIETILLDVRYALRMLRNNPGFTAVAVLTLALGIGANTAIFSVINAVLLRPLPYPDSDRLVFLSEWTPEIRFLYISMADFDDWRSMNTVFESIGAYRPANVTLTGQGEPQHLAIRQVSAGFFPTLGVKPIFGRTLTELDDKVGAEPVVLLSEALWMRQFGRDPRVVGQRVNLLGSRITKVVATLVILLGLMAVAQAQTFTVLHSFTGGQDGANPLGRL